MSKNTMMSPKLINGMSKSDDDDCDYDDNQPHVEECKTQDEVKEYYSKHLRTHFGGRGPNKRKPNSKGFYETTINKENKDNSF